jgi:D-lactate dehydrogenase (cytochrome)
VLTSLIYPLPRRSPDCALDSEECEVFEVESDEAGRERLWEARHEAAFAIENLNPAKKLMSTDVCVPISALPGALREARKTIETYSLDVCCQV